MNGHLTAIRRFVAARHRVRLALTVGHRLWSLALVFVAATVLFHLLFALFPWIVFPFVWDGIVVLFCAGCIAIVAEGLFIRRPGLLSTARLLELKGENNTRCAHPMLAIALELGAASVTNELCDEVYRRAAGQIEVYRNVSFAQKQKWRMPATLFTVLCAACSLMLLRPSLAAYWQLPFLLLRGNEMRVSPGTVSVPRYAPVTLQLVPKERTVPSCQLETVDIGRGKKTVRWLRPDDRGIFSMRIDSIETSFTYCFACGTKRCAPETVTVVAPPLLQRLQVELRPPAYTALPPRMLPEGQGDFSAYSGTRARFSIASSFLRAATIRYGNDTIALRVNGTKAEGDLTIKSSASYSFALEDTFAQRSDSAARFSIVLLPDEAPTVRFLRPGANKNLEPAQRETLWIESADDLGIRSLGLYWCKNGECEGPASGQDLSPPQPVRSWRKQFQWQISRLSLYPGDTLFYWAQTFDTKSFGNRQYATTDTFWFRVPTFEEIHRTMAQREDYARESMGSARARQNELMKDVEQLDKATAGPKGSSWDRQQLARKVEQLMRAQADSLQASVRQLEENVNQLRKEGALGEEIARKMDEIRKTLQELIAQYGDSLLFPKNEENEISLDDMRAAVEKLNEMLPELSKRLDNTLQFLEALKRDRELAELAMRAEKLAQEQTQLAESRREVKSASRQKDLLDRIDKLQKDIRGDPQQDKELSDGQSMRQIDSLGNAMDEQLARRQAPPAGTMQTMSGNLASLAQQLKEKMSSFMMEQLDALRNKLLDLVNSTLDAAAWQEQVRNADRTGDPAGREQARREQARSQQAIGEALGFLQQEMDSLPLLPPSIRQRLRADVAAAQGASKATVQSLGESDGNFGMRISEQSIRQLANSLLETVAAMSQQQQGSCNSGSCGMRESLRRMSGKQAAINAATAQLLRAMMQGRQPGESNGGGEGKGAASEAARKEAQAAQRKLADELAKLGEKFGDASGEGMKKRIEELEKEARNLTRLLDEPREEVTERQDRFLARMLQSALSLHREEEGKEERTSTSAGIIFTKTAGTLSDSALGNNDRFNAVRRRALDEGNYPFIYRASINAYFDSLGVLYLK